MNNKNTFIKVAVLLLAVMFVIPALCASCAKPDDPNTEDTTKAENPVNAQSTTAAETEPAYTVEKQDYKKYEFNIQTYVRDQHNFDYFGGLGTQTGDTLNDAVYKRNLETENLLNIVIVSTPVTSGYKKMASELKTAATTGTYTYDMICSSTTSMTPVALENGLYDMADMASIDFAQPWWDESLNSAYTLGGHRYFVSGDAVTINNDATYIVRFNQKLAAEHGLKLEYFYDLVKNNEWTIDKMLEISKDFKTSNGDDVQNYDDGYGIVAVNTFVQALWYGCDLKIVTKDANDLPVFTDYTDSIQNSYEKIVSVFKSEYTYNSQPKANRMAGKNHAETADAMLVNGNALFQSTVLESMIRTNDSETKVGIMPIPMGSTEQNGYSCIVNPTGFCSGIALPCVIENPERTANVLEALMMFSEDYIRPAYFDTVFQYKVLDDEASYEILNIILESRTAPDLVTIYGWNDMMTTIQDMAVAGQESVSSYYGSVSESIKRQIADVCTKIAAVQ